MTAVRTVAVHAVAHHFSLPEYLVEHAAELIHFAILAKLGRS